MGSLALGRHCVRHRPGRGFAVSLVLLLSACQGHAPGREDPDPATRIEASLTDQVESGGAVANLRAVLVSIDGQTVVEEYYETVPEQHWPVQSVTKSIMATLVGSAVEDGTLDLDSSLAELLPDQRRLMSDSVRSATLRQLLTMTAGFTEEGAPGDAWILHGSIAPVERALRRARGPADFAYSNAGTQVLSAVLVEATGTPVLDYARTRLFDPLGVETSPAWEGVGTVGNLAAWERAGFAWPTDRQGNHFGWGFMKLLPRDLLSLGQLYLDNGRWQGEQLIPADWIEAATTRQVSTEDGPFDGYGYLWWIGTLDGDPAAIAYGLGCQVVAVVPSRELVVAMVSELRLSEPPGPMSRGLPPGTCRTILESTVVSHVP